MESAKYCCNSLKSITAGSLQLVPGMHTASPTVPAAALDLQEERACLSLSPAMAMGGQDSSELEKTLIGVGRLAPALHLNLSEQQQLPKLTASFTALLWKYEVTLLNEITQMLLKQK